MKRVIEANSTERLKLKHLTMDEKRTEDKNLHLICFPVTLRHLLPRNQRTARKTNEKPKI